MGRYGGTGGKVGSGNKEEIWKPTRSEVRKPIRSEIRPVRTPTRSGIRLDIRKKGPGSDRPTPTRKRTDPAGQARPSTITEESRTKRNPIGRDRSGRVWSRYDWKPVSADDSVGDREREEPSTPIREASAVADRRKTEETMGGGEELQDDAESDIGADIRYDG